MARGPGPVAAAHQVLIVTALAGTLWYAAWQGAEVARTGDRLGIVGIVLALVAATGFALYLRRLRARLRTKLTPRA
jgi:hypothetical protein